MAHGVTLLPIGTGIDVGQLTTGCGVRGPTLLGLGIPYWLLRRILVVIALQHSTL